MAGIWLLPNSGLCSKPVMWWTAPVVRFLRVLFAAERFLRESGTPRPTKENKTYESRSYVELENCANKTEMGLWGGEESKNYLLVLKSLLYHRAMMLSCVASEDRIQPSRKMLLRHRFLVPQKEHRFLKIKLPAVVALEGVSELFPSYLSRWLAPSSSLHPDLHTITLPAFSWKLLQIADSMSAWPSAYLQTSGFSEKLDKCSPSFLLRKGFKTSWLHYGALNSKTFLKPVTPVLQMKEYQREWITNGIRGR